MPKLKNQRHERFAQNIAKGMNQAEAYRQAGYAARGNAAEVKASVLVRTVKVKARIAELNAKLERQAIATAQEIREFWTKAMRGELSEERLARDGSPVTLRSLVADRLRAAEALAKAEGVFNRGGGSPGELEAIAAALEAENE